MARQSGKNGFVEVNSVRYDFDEWSADITASLVDMSFFGAGGGEVWVEGVIGNDIQIGGPYNVGSMPLVAGTQYIFNLGLGAGLYLAVIARVAHINIVNKYKDGPRVKADLKASSGSGHLSSIA